jgi:hypothetical protein
MKITCSKCGRINAIKNPEAFRGMKNVVFVCKNKDCKSKIKFKLPNEDEKEEKNESSTIVVPNNAKVKSAQLTYKSTDGELIISAIGLGVNHIGRQANGFNQEIAIKTDDRHMSRVHAVIIGKVQEGNFLSILKDYNSKNKILLNGRIILENEEVYLMEGDKLILGSTQLQYEVNI